MARSRRKKKTRGYSQEIALILTGSALTLCALSVMYGFLIRSANAGDKLTGYRIEIWNGTGEPGLAQRIADAARRKGVDVFQVGNASDFSHRESILIGRKKINGLEDFGRALGCRNFIEQLDKQSLVDATLIVGADYRSLNLFDD